VSNQSAKKADGQKTGSVVDGEQPDKQFFEKEQKEED
jgi:hypothetical protein